MAKLTPRRTKIFVSYSHEDDEWRDELFKHLKTLNEDENLWIDIHNISVGERWREGIHQALLQTRIAVLLISVDFITSDFISEHELPALLNAAECEGVTIIPIHIGKCHIPDSLLELQAVNSPTTTLDKMDRPERNDVWFKVVADIKAALADLVLVTAAEQDLEATEKVLAPLEAAGLGVDLEPWDPSELETAGTRISNKLSKRHNALVFVGADGLGPWEAADLVETLDQMKAGSRRSVAALLPGAPGLSDSPFPLPVSSHIRLHTLDDPRLILRLWNQVTAKRWTGPDPDEMVRIFASTAERPTLSAETSESSSFEDGVDHLARRLRGRDNFTVFLGAGALFSDDQNGNGSKSGNGTDDRKTRPSSGQLSEAPGKPVRICDVTRFLLDEIGLSHEDFLPPLDVVGSYYETQHGERRLETTIHDLVGGRNSSIPPPHLLIASLFKQLGDQDGKKDSPRLLGQTSKKRHPRLIVTTNFDLLMERALIEKGIPFTRIVQNRSGSSIHINEYKEIEVAGKNATIVTRKEVATVPLDKPNKVGEAISVLGLTTLTNFSGTSDPESGTNSLHALNLGDFTPPYLYKFHGSEDIQGSCAITIDQYFCFMRAVLRRKIVPTQIEAYLTKGQVLFLGYGLFDPDLRVIAYTLLRKMEEGEKKWRHALLRPPEQELSDDYRRAELNLWRQLKEKVRDVHGINVIEGESVAFLQELVKRVTSQR